MEANEIGKPLYWDLNKHVESVIQMIRADEIQIALKMIDDVPAWYRKNRPKELEQIRRTLFSNLYDQIEYATDNEEAECTREFGEAQWINGYMFPRAKIITDLVKRLNDQNKAPWIFDLGCSHGNLPLGLAKENLDFNYLGAGMNWRIREKVKDWAGKHWQEEPLKVQPTILYCTEVIEHCMSPMDIVQSAYKVGVDWDHILLSVPLGCLGGGLENWDTRRLGHVRGWTEQEFFDFAHKNWPGYKWELTVAPSMVLLGVKQ